MVCCRYSKSKRDCHGHDRMVHFVVGFTTVFAISAYHHWCCEFKCCSLQGVHDTTLCDKVCQWLAIHVGRWFSPISSTNNTDRYNIAEILLMKVALNTIKSNQTKPRADPQFMLYFRACGVYRVFLSQKELHLYTTDDKAT